MYKDKCTGPDFKSIKPEDLTFTVKFTEGLIPKPKEYQFKWMPFKYVLLIQPEFDGLWELLITNIPDFKLRTQKPFQIIRET